LSEEQVGASSRGPLKFFYTKLKFLEQTSTKQ
jgi:hypothetical protein